MKHFFLAFTCLACLACRNTTVPPPSASLATAPRWEKLLDSADWKKSYNFQMFSLRDTLWVFHPDGTWFSADGWVWQKSPLPNAIGNLAFLDYVPFKNAVYGLGHFEGNIEQFSFQPVIYRSTDLRHWDTLSHHSNLPPRFFYHPFVFNDSIWIIGGEDKNGRYADVWNSEDGVNWIKQAERLPLGERSGSQVVSFHNRLFLLDNDVWSSTDALNWQRETPEILRGEQVFGYAPVVFGDRIWLIGCNRNGLFYSQILGSADGKNWDGWQAPWSPRGGVAAAVHHNRVFMTGGKYGGLPDAPEFIYSNDLWAMSPPE